MNLFNIGRFFSKDRDRQRQSEAQQREAESFNLAPQGGFISVLKYALFIFFGYYNVRLFLTTVPGFEGPLTALFALFGEATALYCLRNFTRSTGRHKAALGVAGVAFTVFSVTHAVFSFFKLEQNVRTSGLVQFYCENIAFPVLFTMLVVAAIALPLLHWRTRVAAEQAKAQCEIAESRARMLAETARMRDETELEHARLGQLEERLKIETAYANKLDDFARLKARQAQTLAGIADPQLRAMIAAELGVSEASGNNAATEPPQGNSASGFGRIGRQYPRSN
jgi:hypothetical protein